MKTAVACTCALLLAGCAGWPQDAARVSQELLRLSGLALATAASEEDVRTVLRQALRAGPRERVVHIAGHRFVLSPATLDVAAPESGAVAGRYRWLVAQSIELTEQVCLPFQAESPGMRPAADATGSITLATSAEQVQRVTVGIELQEGCIVALHVEQASAVPRD
jgi:hypothetical protein